MKKKVTALIICAFMIINFAGCNKTAKPATTTETVKKETNITETSSVIPDEKPENKAPLKQQLNGEWILKDTEVEGEKLTAEEAGLESEITIENNSAQYFMKTAYETRSFEATLEFLEEPLYYDCQNDVWCVKFNVFNSNFGEDEDFYATLTDENTLLLRHLFPFDGTQGVSHQTYTRK